jgi:pimeloyl-ACP methyl ester carboxylesterase
MKQLIETWRLVNATNGQARLRVFTAGDGPTIVMLPGRGFGPSSLEPLAERLLAAGFRIVLPEPRGCGESSGPLDGVTLRDLAVDVAASIESVGGAPIVLAGHAFGNRVARMLATDRPDLVRGVVLMAAGGKFPPGPEAARNLQMSGDPNLTAEVREMAAKAALFGPQSSPTPDDFMRGTFSADAIKMQIAATDSFPLESWWSGGKAPMLVIQGLADVMAPPENGRSLKADYPDRVTLVELDGLGHLMTRERPDLVADAIVAFARDLVD